MIDNNVTAYCGKDAGILLHISSLPSNWGIGTFGESAYRFVDFLAETNQKYWQILPLGITGYGNSPYQSASSFAGNIYFIDLDILASEGLLKVSDYSCIDWGDDPERVDFACIYAERAAVLRIAARNFDTDDAGYISFCRNNDYWLADFALYMAIKERFYMASFDRWQQEYARRDEKTLAAFERENSAAIDFYKITQYFFYKQAAALKSYANSKGIKLIGDMPFYTAYDSADVWANPGLFVLDDNLAPVEVAGVPPDAFSDTGQLWGNPIYNFAEMAKDGYAWWTARVSQGLKLCDALRIDHFRAFESYYTIPFGSKDAVSGKWVFGVGKDLLGRLNIDKSKIIAEDLGIITDSVRRLIDDTGFCCMKVLQFAFGGGTDNPYLAHNYKSSNCVVYTGTHDNDTTAGWYRKASLEVKSAVLRFVPYSAYMPKTRSLIRYAMESPAALAIVPMQDYLGLGSFARMNTPSTPSGNWEWRLLPNYDNPKLRHQIKELTSYRNMP